MSTDNHWFNAQEALSVGLVDEIIPVETPPPIYPDQPPVTSPVETDVDALAAKLATELLFRLRSTFNDPGKFNSVLAAAALENFSATVAAGEENALPKSADVILASADHPLT